MEFLAGLWNYVIVFLAILTVVVFVHELGHYLVARWAGVRVEVFSIGFGREIWGWTAKSGTRWRISLLPLGGYVRMFGESDAAVAERETPLTPEERAVSFQAKSVGRRAAIVVAGPAANFIFGILLMAGVFIAFGQPVTAPIVGTVQPDSAAAEAGFEPGDRILRVDGVAVEAFQDMQRIVQLRLDRDLVVEIEREGRVVTLTARPRVVEMKDAFGSVRRTPLLGIHSAQNSTEIVRHNPFSATWQAAKETGTIVSTALTAIGQMIVGTRDSDEIGGPIRIAKGAGQAAQLGMGTVLFYTIFLSINLGLINLFPIPLLDGGHLLFYGIEAVRGRPLTPRTQEYGFRIGLFLVFALMIFATRNDLVDLKVWELFKGLVS